MTGANLRRLLVGEPLPTARAVHERLAKVLALPIFASDAISSSAYAVEEILMVTVLAGAVGMRYSAGVAAAIGLLFLLVTISYRQTVHAYPSGGGAYIVAHENLGVVPGLLAAAALLADYVLTVAVSVASGVAAITSAVPALLPYHVTLCLLAIAVITLATLRGARESGKLFAPPVYVYIATVLLMVIVGLVRLLVHGAPPAVHPIPLPVQGLGLFLLLRAFAGGCSALTGIEAIANGVPAFRAPQARNAALTLVWMAVICVTIFAGTSVLAQGFHIIPRHEQTVFSTMGHAVFGNGFLYLLLQASTAAILILAANTSFAGFPRLASILGQDGFAPRQLANLGDRLVFANGIVLLGLASAALIVAFGGTTHRLIPLYAVGVFISFTLSQAGMVIYWRRQRSRGWHVKAAVNALGAVATCTVLAVVGSVKFVQGAWIVLVFIPLLMLAFSSIARHYRELGRILRLSPRDRHLPDAIRHAVLVVLPALHRGVIPALSYAKTISPNPEAVYVETDPAETPRFREAWEKLSPDLPLTVLKSPSGSFADPLLRYTRTLRSERRVDLVTVIIPEFVASRWWHGPLWDRSGLLLKLALLFEPGVVVANLRYRPQA